MLGRVRHSDRTDIITLYTRERGREAFAVAAGSGRAAQARAARLQLLSVVEFEASRKPGLEMGRMGQIASSRVWHSLYRDPEKGALVFFLSDFLNRLLRESAAEPLIWEYIIEEVGRLDRMEGGIGNFHISFLMGILPLAGIEPDWEGWREGSWFDMRTGEFTLWKPTGACHLSPEEAKSAARLLRAGSHAVGRMRIGRKMRGRILDALLAYIGVHYPGAANLGSLSILREIYG